MDELKNGFIEMDCGYIVMINSDENFTFPLQTRHVIRENAKALMMLGSIKKGIVI